MQTISDTHAMIAGMTPVRMPGRWVFVCDAPDSAAADAFAVIREAEGVTLILPEHAAVEQGCSVDLVMAQITLNVFSDLEGVGLTAAVAAALTEKNISCNVIAGYHHDHVFVPERDADRALAALLDLQARTET